MAVRRFELDTIPADIQARNLNGYQLSELGYAVHKFDAASTSPTLITENIVDLVAVTGVTQAGNVITFDSNAANSLGGLGVVNVVNKYILIDGGSISASDVNGTHISFYNCAFTVISSGAGGNNWALGSTIAAGQGTRTAQTGGTDASVANSVNLYGCSLATIDPAAWFQVSDAIDCTITFGSFLNNASRWNTAQGGRWINLTIKNGAASTVNPYGATLLQNVVPDLLRFRLGNTGGGQPNFNVFDRPAFEDPNQLSYIDLNWSGLQANSGTIIGGPFFGNNQTDTFGSAGTGIISGGPISSDNILQRAGGVGVFQFAAIAPTYLDADTGNAVQGVSVRFISNINPAGLTGSASTLPERVDASLPTVTNGQIINQGITGVDGRLTTNRYLISTDNGATFTTDEPGYFNFLDWNVQTAQGLSSFGIGTNTDALVANAAGPQGLMFSPIMRGYLNRVGGANETTVATWTAAHSRRAYTHTLEVAETIAEPALRGDVYYDDADISLPNLVGVSVKSQNVSAGQPDISFPAGSPVSINDVRDAFRAGWYHYGYDLTDGDHLTPAINLVLNNVLATDFTATATSINIRANGIARDGSNDLFTADSLGTGDFGGGSLNSHDLTFSGAVTQLGDVVNSTITAPSIALTSFSDSRDSTFNGNITGALSSSFVEGMTFGDGTISFTGLASSISDITTILGTGYSFTNNGGVTLSSATATTIDVTPADITALGITVAEGASTSPVNNITYRYPAEVFTNTVTIPTAGRIRVERVSDKNQVITQSVVTQGQTFDIDYGAGSTLKAADVVRVYFQPSDTALQPVVYDTTVSTLAINVTTRPDALYATSTYTTVPGMSTDAGRMIVSFANNITNGPDTQRAFLLAATTSAYFTLLYTQNTGKAANATLEFDFINGGANGSSVIKGDHVRLTSDLQDDAIADLEQRTIVNAVDTDTASDFIINFDNVDFATVVIEVQGNLSEAATRLLLQEELVPIAAGVVSIEGDVNELESNQVTITANQQVLLTATQRGALKAATYSAGSITQASNVD